ncbi:MAG: hypothetical protein E7544_05620 [Ruminococcaceae bacterium]|nr:hypothetical protein [Oscillospiraceae bacterium]
MKKFLAIILALICAFSTCTLSVGALSEDIFGDIIEDQFGVTQEKDEADTLSYGIHYSSGTLATITVLYEPAPNIRFEVPTEVTVTSDTPIAVDHVWVCWKDRETGKLYYPGDVILVDGKITLEAVWEEKTDNYPRFIRSAIAGVQALLKLIEKFFGFFDAINSTKPIEPTEPTEPTLPVTEPTTVPAANA